MSLPVITVKFKADELVALSEKLKDGKIRASLGLGLRPNTNTSIQRAINKIDQHANTARCELAKAACV